MVFILLLGAGLVAAPWRAAAQSPQAAIDGIFAGWDGRTSAGCAVGVTRGTEMIFTDAWGMANLEWEIPNTPGTLFEAGSVSKQFTAGAIVLLVLEGKLSMDDDIRKFVPEVPDYGTPIRIRHLLNHTSGLRDWGSVASIAGWGREQRTHTHAHVLDIIARQTSLNYPPGAAYSYTNSGFNLLAIIVERVTGQPFAEFSRERIFEPLGLTHTQWRDDYQRIVPGRSTGYSPAGEGVYRINHPIEDVHGNGGLITTVGDLLKWTSAIREGGFGGEGFEELMHEQGVLTNGQTIFYASGLQIDRYRGTRRVSHTGSTSGFRAYLGHFPDEDLSVAILCNAANAVPGSLGPAVSDVFLSHLPEATATPPRGISVAASALRAREGLYRERNTGAPMRLTFADNTLRSGNTVLTPLSRTEFALGTGEVRLHFDGESSGFRTTEEGYPAGEYIPVPEFTPSPGDLQVYTGHYRSAEAETELRVGRNCV